MMMKKTVVSPAKHTITIISPKFLLFAAKVSLLSILLSVPGTEISFVPSEMHAQVAVSNTKPGNRKSEN